MKDPAVAAQMIDDAKTEALDIVRGARPLTDAAAARACTAVAAEEDLDDLNRPTIPVYLELGSQVRGVVGRVDITPGEPCSTFTTELATVLPDGAGRFDPDQLALIELPRHVARVVVARLREAGVSFDQPERLRIILRTDPFGLYAQGREQTSAEEP
jgi:hypothetical protein